MKKLLTGLTFLISISSFANDVFLAQASSFDDGPVKAKVEAHQKALDKCSRKYKKCDIVESNVTMVYGRASQLVHIAAAVAYGTESKYPIILD